MLRSFFARIIEWDWDDAPRRNPVLKGDIPPRPDPLPRFLDDDAAAKLMITARAATDPRDRLIIELLARTGSASERKRPASPLTPSSMSAMATGCASRSASSATIDSCRCIPSSSSSSTTGVPPTSITSAPTADSR